MALGNYEYQTDFVRNIVAREKQAEQDGLERGLQKGLQQGLQQGLQRTLTTQLRAKFAATDAELTPLSTATVQQLEAWACRVLTANSVEEVFATE